MVFPLRMGSKSTVLVLGGKVNIGSSDGMMAVGLPRRSGCRGTRAMEDDGAFVGPSLASPFDCLSPDGLKNRETSRSKASKALTEPAAQCFSFRLSTRRILPSKARTQSSKGIEKFRHKADVKRRCRQRCEDGEGCMRVGGNTIERQTASWYTAVLPCAQKQAISRASFRPLGMTRYCRSMTG